MPQKTQLIHQSRCFNTLGTWTQIRGVLWDNLGSWRLCSTLCTPVNHTEEKVPASSPSVPPLLSSCRRWERTGEGRAVSRRSPARQGKESADVPQMSPSAAQQINSTIWWPPNKNTRRAFLSFFTCTTDVQALWTATARFDKNLIIYSHNYITVCKYILHKSE